MKKISYEDALALIGDYVDRLKLENKLDPKKDEFTVILPLEDREGVIFNVSKDKNRERKVSVNISDNIILMKKVKNTTLSIFEVEDWNE